MSVEKSTLDQLRIDRRPDRSRSPVGWIIALLFLLLALGAGIFWWKSTGSRPTVETAPAIESSRRDQLTVLNASGYVTARRDATVSSKVTGKIVAVLVEEGMSVAEGDVLARLDTSNVEANLRLAEAQLEVARSSVKETEVRLREAKLEFTRIDNLVRDGVATPAELDTARAELDSLTARYQRQEEEIKVAERQIGLWQQEQEDRIIRAPFSGVVISKDAQTGEMISPVSAGGGFTRTGICTLVDMESLEIEVDVNESYINRVKPGQPVEATLDAYPSWKIPAHVIAIVPTADRQKATVKVRIGLAQLDPRILPDMGVKVAFQDETSQDMKESSAVSVPAAAIRLDGEKKVVFVVHEGRLERRAVALGEEDGDRVLVRSGLRSGERVVVKGPLRLTEGEAIVERRH